jgi:hypothetical protein
MVKVSILTLNSQSNATMKYVLFFFAYHSKKFVLLFLEDPKELGRMPNRANRLSTHYRQSVFNTNDPLKGYLDRIPGWKKAL